MLLLLGAYKLIWGSKCVLLFLFVFMWNLLEIVRGAQTSILEESFRVIEVFSPLVVEVEFDFHAPYISSCLGT
jgi:hypothetical protein